MHACCTCCCCCSPYRKALALVFIEALLRQPSLVQPRPLRPFSRPLNDRQAAPLVYAVSALKWLSLSAYEAVVPRLLQVRKEAREAGSTPTWWLGGCAVAECMVVLFG